MTVIHGFELVQEQDIPEISSKARLFRHLRTGARLLSVQNDDENKSFGVAFKTPSYDDTGVPHILEHSVLNGSRKYRTKEPFVTLLKTSVNTFLNAMTFNDFTVYPVASTNLKDFWNLVDVYMDAVFYPAISEKTLQQEGWHHETSGDHSTLNYKGVVFNEMKGAYSTPEAVMETVSRRELLPDTPYRHDIGGDPASIPNLTYDAFKRFHANYYHPSNSFIYFYGDDDPEERLRYVDAFIADFEAHPANPEFPLQPRFDAPRTHIERYDAGEAGEEANKGFVKVSWLLPEVTDAERLLELEILSYILVATPASPVRKALIDSGLGEDLTSEGVDRFTRQASFSVGMKGIVPGDAQEVETLIMATLSDLTENGISKEMIEAAFNTTEFSLREKNTGRFPRGLSAYIGILPAWIHGGDPMTHLAFESSLEAIKARYAEQPGCFENMIGKYLLDNPHRSTVILQPDPQVKSEREAAEAARLQRERAGMTNSGIDRILADMAELERIQTTPDTPEALATIPTLRLSDLDRQAKTTPTEVIPAQGAQIVYHDLPTNGVAYVDFGFDLYSLPARLIPYVDLFGAALTEIGTEKEDFVQLSTRVGAKTGGIGASVFTSTKYRQPGSIAYLFVRAKSMMHQTGDLFAILRDMLLTVKLDNRERFTQMVLEEKASMESGLLFGGHQVAASRIAAAFDDAGWANEQMGGVSGLLSIRALAERLHSDWAGVLADLEAIRAALINRNALVVNVTMGAADWAGFRPQLMDFLAVLPAREIVRHAWERTTTPTYEALTVPAQVNFVGKGARLTDLGYTVHGSQAVILNHMNFDYLWNKIRVQGGAYGGGSFFNPFSGVFTFFSYRDPNLVNTLKVYDAAGEYLRGVDLSADELEKAIIGAIGNVDTYLLPDAKGFQATTRYLIGYTDAERQCVRDEMFATSLAHFRTMGDALAQVGAAGRVAVVTSPDGAAKANGELEHKLAVTTVL
jgi:hypothetical protein